MQTSSRYFWIFIVFCLLLLLSFTFYIWEEMRVRRHGRILSCQDNLEQIFLDVERYRMEHEGSYPSSLLTMYELHRPTLGFFRCPASGNRAEITIENLDKEGDYALSDEIDETLNESNQIILLEKQAWHQGRRNACFSSGEARLLEN
jgi:hypothetical protein